MARIYLDMNVFSNLKRREGPVFTLINQAIEKYRTNLSFIFPSANIRDKRRNLTERNLKDFEYMSSLTGENHISYHGIEKRTTFYLALPRKVFDDKTDGSDLFELAHFWDTSGEEGTPEAILKNN